MKASNTRSAIKVGPLGRCSPADGGEASFGDVHRDQDQGDDVPGTHSPLDAADGKPLSQEEIPTERDGSHPCMADVVRQHRRNPASANSHDDREAACDREPESDERIRPGGLFRRSRDA